MGIHKSRHLSACRFTETFEQSQSANREYVSILIQTMWPDLVEVVVYDYFAAYMYVQSLWNFANMNNLSKGTKPVECRRCTQPEKT